jgi:hypothetical protein
VLTFFGSLFEQSRNVCQNTSLSSTFHTDPDLLGGRRLS